jgi:hypothetical protein
LIVKKYVLTAGIGLILFRVGYGEWKAFVNTAMNLRAI